MATVKVVEQPRYSIEVSSMEASLILGVLYHVRADKKNPGYPPGVRELMNVLVGAGVEPLPDYLAVEGDIVIAPRRFKE